MAPEIIAQSAAPHSNHFNQIEFLHSTGQITPFFGEVQN
jgi:hypothetical protein